MTVSSVGGTRPHHHACRVHQFNAHCHHLTACVKVNGEHFARSC